MAEEEVNVISHLLDVEHSASGMISGAQLEADKRVAFARVKADEEYKKQSDQIVSECESMYAVKTAEIVQKHDDLIAQHKSEFENTPEDRQSFNRLLELTLFSA